MGISFTRPEWLLALPLIAAALVWSARGSFAGLAGARQWLAWGARIGLMLALVFALAGAQLVQPARDLAVIFALDASHSVPTAERERALEFVREALEYRGGDDHAALVVFGREALVESESLSKPADVQVVSDTTGGYSNLAGGLRLALGMVPPESAGRVVLLSDGNENMGSATEEVLAARAGRVTVDVVPLGTRVTQDVLVDAVDMPSAARQGEPVPVRVAVRSSHPAQASVTVLVDDEPINTQTMTLGAGSTSLVVPVQFEEPGLHRVDVAVSGTGDDCPENNVGSGFVRVRGEPRVLVVDGVPEEAGALRRALRELDIEVTVVGPAGMPTDAADLEAWDAVLLSDLPAWKMQHRQMMMLRDAVRDRGIGLGMVGGEMSFGAGGYYRTPVEEALPVTMDVTKQRVFPAAAVLIVMDTSGSMGMEEDGSTKIELAAEAGAAVVDLLQPYDSVGFLASDPAPTMVCELRTLENKESVKADIRSVRPGGGGIAVYPSLSAAYDVLADSKAPTRHIIMLADGSDCDEQGGSVALVHQMAGEKITTTAIAFGDGPHVPFLQDVARAGGGQYYLAERARDLKAIFTREALTVAKSVLIEESFRAQPAEASEVTSGVDFSTAPPLLGYVATSRRGLAKTPLVSHKDDPLLAHWNFGLGRSIAFTSDAKAHWAAHWLGWSGFGKLWGQAVRWVLRRPDSGDLQARVERSGDQARVVVEAIREDGSVINGLDVRATMAMPDGSRQDVPLPQSGPGTYAAQVEAAASGPYVVGVNAQGPSGFSARQSIGFSVDYPPDYADTEPNESLLRSLARQTGGQVMSDPAAAFEPPEIAPKRRTDIWRLLLWLAALVLPLDVAVRRLVVSREDVARAMAMAGAAASRLKRPRREPEPATVDRLLEVARAERDRRLRDVPTVTTTAPPADPSQITAPPVTAPDAEPKPAPEQEAAPEEEAPADESMTERLLRKKREMRKGS
jgi:uncharacterized membrane protein